MSEDGYDAAADPSPAERMLFDDTLSCRPRLRARFDPVDLDLAGAQAMMAGAETLLRQYAQIEDTQAEEAEDHGPRDLALQRIEARLLLLSEQVATLLRERQPPLPERMLHWSINGVSLAHEVEVGPGTCGRLRIELADWLPRPLELPVEVLDCAGQHPDPQLWLRFMPRNDALDALLERHLFRLHRREIAESRRLR